MTRVPMTPPTTRPPFPALSPAAEGSADDSQLLQSRRQTSVTLTVPNLMLPQSPDDKLLQSSGSSPPAHPLPASASLSLLLLLNLLPYLASSGPAVVACPLFWPPPPVLPP